MYTTRPVVSGKKGVVSTGHYLATSAGLKMFAKGGNAIDAGVAAGFALAVLEPHKNSLGGECPILIYSPGEKGVKAISGQGVAPKSATIEWFKKNKIDMIPGDGFLGATVPSLFGAYCTALLKYGRLTLRDILEPAIELAEDGFPLYESLRNSIAGLRNKFIEDWPTSAEIFTPGGKVPGLGELLKQPSLADTLKKLAQAEDDASSEGREAAVRKAMDYFYKGEIARKIVEFARNNPVKDATGEYHAALLDYNDFSEYETRVEEAVFADYKDCRIFKCGPWTQGPVFLQQLKLLEGFKLNEAGHNSPEYIHLVVECTKRAFVDRERYYGDPLFTEVPLGKLLSDEYNKQEREKIDLLHADYSRRWEEEKLKDDETYKGDTTHLDVIDDEGFMISATPSGAWIPSSPVIPGVGFPLGTRAQMFNLTEGRPNCLQPGKRPRATLTPSIAFRNGKPWMAFGTPGGDMQDQWTLQFFLNVVEFNMNIQQAIDAPSFHTTFFPSSFYPHGVNEGVYVEKSIGYEVFCKLQGLGHKLTLMPDNSNAKVCAVCLNHDTGVLQGAASSKSDGQGYALGW